MSTAELPDGSITLELWSIPGVEPIGGYHFLVAHVALPGLVNVDKNYGKSHEITMLLMGKSRISMGNFQ